MGNRACSIRHDKIMANLPISFEVTGVNCLTVDYRSKIKKTLNVLMSAAYIQVHFRQDLITEANTMNLDQTAPGSSLILVHIVHHKDYLRK